MPNPIAPAAPEPDKGSGQSLQQGGSIQDVILYEMLHNDDYMIGSYAKTDKVKNDKLTTPTKLTGERVEYNDEKMAAMGLDCVTQMMGEITHLALMHPERRKNLVGDMVSLRPFADLAADLAVFHNLSSEKRNVSGKFPKPSDFGLEEGLSMEEYFIKLIEKAKEKGHDPESMPKMQSQPGQGQGQGQGEGEGDGPPDPNPTSQDIMKALGVDPKGKQEQDHSGWGQVPVGAQEAAKQAMIEGLGKNKGNIPLGMQRILNQLCEEKEDIRWQERLRRLVGTRFASRKYRRTLKHPSRRWGIGYSGKRKKKRGTLTVAIDTSGSMSEVDLGLCLHHLRTISACHEAPLEIIIVDCDIHERKYLRTQKDIAQLDLKGGGGTSTLPVFNALIKHPPDMLIFLTDLYTDFPEKAPKYPVIWGIVNNPQGKAPWGENFHIETHEDGKKKRR